YGLEANENYKNFSEVIPWKRTMLDVVVQISGEGTSRRQFDKGLKVKFLFGEHFGGSVG
ncbi:hypothetical protein A2U01_0061843, partial [Trifolium medium]|nr:hypothetical protein [Trifolium medium]